MKKPFIITFVILLLTLFIILLLQNGYSVEIKFLFWGFNTTIAIYSLLSLISGFIISSIIFFPMWLRKRTELKKAQHELVDFLKANTKSEEHISEKNQNLANE